MTPTLEVSLISRDVHRAQLGPAYPRSVLSGLVVDMRVAEDRRRASARLLAALTVLLPVAAASVQRRASSRGLVGEGAGSLAWTWSSHLYAAAGARIRASRALGEEEIEECTDNTSVGDAEAGIAIYYDQDACNRADPLVGCNGEPTCSSTSCCKSKIFRLRFLFEFIYTTTEGAFQSAGESLHT